MRSPLSTRCSRRPVGGRTKGFVRATDPFVRSTRTFVLAQLSSGGATVPFVALHTVSSYPPATFACPPIPFGQATTAPVGSMQSAEEKTGRPSRRQNHSTNRRPPSTFRRNHSATCRNHSTIRRKRSTFRRNVRPRADGVRPFAETVQPYDGSMRPCAGCLWPSAAGNRRFPRSPYLYK